MTIHNSYPVDTTTVDILLDGVIGGDRHPRARRLHLRDVRRGQCGRLRTLRAGMHRSRSPQLQPGRHTRQRHLPAALRLPGRLEPVCGYDYFSGLTITFNNLCELECAGAYLQWEGDCSTPPVYGCMDPDALNFDPDATVDSGYCLYIPECGDDHLVTLTSVATGLDTLGLDGNVFGSIASGYFSGMDGSSTRLSVPTMTMATTPPTAAWPKAATTSTCIPIGTSRGQHREVSVDGGDPGIFVLGRRRIRRRVRLWTGRGRLRGLHSRMH